ncbi:hypothetical protein P154DRAFT_528112 [Amniculicola lignicola CBS 123094]|uniref:Uncharacterized protein n=1 Tax=Amniculicola lignicola CBS 123094 TaxID=1392246 RepID=A0A6A5VTW4_9PLEO|nr:hypothetical protein P154DRAFT_528112 [Amniculicola lignicola CBS 123094]
MAENRIHSIGPCAVIYVPVSIFHMRPCTPRHSSLFLAATADPRCTETPLMTGSRGRGTAEMHGRPPAPAVC